jgi:predicted SnoaL-like aldol condensation-catalyzing enzyme
MIRGLGLSILAAMAAGVGILTFGAARAQPAPTSTRDFVVSAVDAIFVRLETDAVDRAMSPAYTQHNLRVPDGADGLKAMLTRFRTLPNYRYERFRVLADGDLVVLHGRYTGVAPTPLIAFDVFRVADGKIVEHWDGLQAEVEKGVSGRSMIDGPTEVEDQRSTARNRRLVMGFVQSVLIEGDFDKASRFVSATAYAQHNPRLPDGFQSVVGFFRQLQESGRPLRYLKVHNVIADGNFVLTRAEATLAGAPTIVFDLFRVERGRIVEHWDVLQPVPPVTINQNSAF